MTDYIKLIPENL